MENRVENIAIQRNSISEFLSNKEYLKNIEEKRISPEIFNQKYKIYSKEEIDRDTKESLRLKNIHEGEKDKEKKKLKDISTVSEFIIFNLFNKDKIFGDNFSAVIPSFYDDQKNQTDIIIEYKRISESGKKISNGAFVVDITNGEEARKNKLIQLFEGQNIKKPKYYIPEGETKTGKFPRLILKIDISDVEKMINFWNKDTENKEYKELIKKISENIKEQFVKLSDYLAGHFKKIDMNVSVEYDYLSKILNKNK